MTGVAAAGMGLPVGVLPLAALLARRRPLLLMTDYDGTLVPLRSTPAAARPAAATLRLLRQAARTPGLVLAVVSGRDLDDLQRLLPLPGCYLVGAHGAAYRRPDGTVFVEPAAARVAPTLAAVAALARRCVGAATGFLVEEKRGAVALHYRLAAPAAAAAVVRSFQAVVAPLLTAHNLAMLAGKMVVEVRPRGVHKGRAVARLRQWQPGYFPVFLGDDTTDEDAFRALADEGLGVLVGDTPRPTAARWHLAGPREVAALLGELTSDGVVNGRG